MINDKEVALWHTKAIQKQVVEDFIAGLNKKLKEKKIWREAELTKLIEKNK